MSSQGCRHLNLPGRCPECAAEAGASGVLAVSPARQALVKAIWSCIVDASSMNVVMSGAEVNAAMDAYRDAVRADAEATLDVRRVVKAIENVAARHGLKKEPPAPLARIYGYTTTPDDMDAQIAAEYAALGETRP